MNKTMVNCLFLLLLSLSACYRSSNFMEQSIASNMKDKNNSDNEIEDESIDRMSWFGITVGKSTIEDLNSSFGEPISIRSFISSEDDQSELSQYIYDKSIIWVSNEKVVGIEFATFGKRSPDEVFPETIQDLVALYGQPSIVGWSSRYGPNHRFAVWSQIGVGVEIKLSYQINRPISIVHFEPVGKSDFLKSIFSFLVSLERPIQGDVIDTSEQDPFDWGT